MTARAGWLQLGIRLEWLTLGWNSVEAIVAVSLGWLAGSIALVGFGFDSVVEVGSGLVLLWRLRLEQRRQLDGEAIAELERRALRLVGISFIGLAAWVGFESARKLWTGEAPEASPLGLMLALASLVVMPCLAWAKRRTARALASPALRADAVQTSICAYLSAALVAGLGLHAWLGWWWADPVAALCMIPMMIMEGRRALRGEACCDSSAVCSLDGQEPIGVVAFRAPAPPAQPLLGEASGGAVEAPADP